MRILLAVILFSFMPLNGVAFAKNSAASAARSELAALPSEHRRAVVIMVAVLLERNSRNLALATPKEISDSTKVIAFENMAMSWLARDVGWPEMQSYYQDSAESLARLIRGEVKGDAGIKEASRLESRRKSLMLNAVQQAERSGFESNQRVEALAEKLKIEIASRARISVWGGPKVK